VSYLNPLRLHFSGSFLAAVPTVNNDPLHYDSGSFQPSYQEPAAGTEPNGWFNPRGSGDWRLSDCAVTAAFLADGSPAAAAAATGGGDPVLTALVADSDRAAPAKMVDLDPEQQMVSMIFGLQVRIVSAAGGTLLAGQFEPAAFIDIWDRGLGGPAGTGPAGSANRTGGFGTARAGMGGPPGDLAAGAMYQSVLTGLEWGDISASPFLRQLRDAATEGILSIKFNVDGIDLDPASPRFLMGRIAGAIGPAAPGEPRHFVLGRQFMAAPGHNPRASFFAPAGGINFCAGVVDIATRRVYLDLGNALPTDGPGGPLADLGDLMLCLPPAPVRAPAPPPTPRPVGTLAAAEYTAAAWYPATAGIVAFPPDRPLTEDELAAAAASPLLLYAAGADGVWVLAISEPANGLFARADQFVFRLNPGDEADVDLYATRFGWPCGGAGVLIVPVPGQLQPGVLAPPTATPAEAIGYDTRLVTDETGRARLTLRASDPGRPRRYIDGQVYALYPVLEETLGPVLGAGHTRPYPFNQWNFISVRAWSGFAPGEPPTWYADIEPILRQYANLYPVMRDFLDLSDYDAVGASAGLLALAFGLDITDPNAMPVTRDLSSAKRAAIVRWLSQPGPDGRPLLGTPPGSAATAAGQPRSTGAAAPGPAAPDAGDGHWLGGKAAAAGRRPGGHRPGADSLAVPPATDAPAGQSGPATAAGDGR
jgi:hypothetical protein